MSNVTLHDFLTRALGGLPQKQRFVFECYHGLRGEREYSQGEIADLMGVSRIAVVKLYDRAVKTLQGIAEGYTFQKVEEAYLDPARPSGEVDGAESVCLSPFLPHLYGLPPGPWPDGLREEWMCSDSE